MAWRGESETRGEAARRVNNGWVTAREGETGADESRFENVHSGSEYLEMRLHELVSEDTATALLSACIHFRLAYAPHALQPLPLSFSPPSLKRILFSPYL